MKFPKKHAPALIIAIWLGSLLLTLAAWGIAIVLGIEAIQWFRRN